MIVKNMTATMQELKLREFTGERKEYSIYLQPHGSVEIGRVELINKSKALQTEDFEVVPLVEEVLTKTVTPEVPSQEESDEIESPEVPVVEDKFICEVCNAEFASSRGLASHKSKAHQ